MSGGKHINSGSFERIVRLRRQLTHELTTVLCITAVIYLHNNYRTMNNMHFYVFLVTLP